MVSDSVIIWCATIFTSIYLVYNRSERFYKLIGAMLLAGTGVVVAVIEESEVAFGYFAVVAVILMIELWDIFWRGS